METVDVDKAGLQLARLIDSAMKGEDSVIIRAGEPVARLASVAPLAGKPRRLLGALAGQIDIPDDFDAPLPDDVLDAFEGR